MYLVLKIEITPDEYRRLESAKIDLTKLIKSAIAILPEPTEESNGLTGLREPQVERIECLRGKFACLTSPENYASEELHRQRQLVK